MDNNTETFSQVNQTETGDISEDEVPSSETGPEQHRARAKRFIISDKLHLLAYYEPRLDMEIMELVAFQSGAKSAVVNHSETETGVLISGKSARKLLTVLEDFFSESEESD